MKALQIDFSKAQSKKANGIESGKRDVNIHRITFYQPKTEQIKES